MPQVSTLRLVYLKGIAIPLQAWRGSEGYRKLRLLDFKTIDTRRWYGCHPYATAAFRPRKYSWYSILLEAESVPRPQCGRKDYVNEKFQLHHREMNQRPSDLQRSTSTKCATAYPPLRVKETYKLHL